MSADLKDCGVRLSDQERPMKNTTGLYKPAAVSVQYASMFSSQLKSTEGAVGNDIFQNENTSLGSSLRDHSCPTQDMEVNDDWIPQPATQ